MLTPDPIVSVIIANYNGARFMRDAVASACNQTLRAIEILVIDDASSDKSVDIATELAGQDARIRVVARKTRSGPGAARNEGIAAARGRWIAVFDSDDMMHPSRLGDLVREAELSNADICADDLLIFQDGAPPSSHLSRRQRKLGWVTAADFVDRIYGGEPSLGYLKPLISTAFLRTHGIRYKPELLIGEDYNLILQLLAKGAKFRLLDTLTYFYRKHGDSISHRLTGAHLERMLKADAQLRPQFPEHAHDVARAFQSRRASIERAMAYADIISALKNRQWREAGAVALRNPRAIPLLAMPVTARLRRLLLQRKRATANRNDKRICLISRQQLIGCTNGSSTYLITLAGALRDAGHKITLISPSVATLGRWPFLRLRPEMAVFDEVHVRGTIRIGDRLRVAIAPHIALSAAAAIAARLASRLGLDKSSWDKPAPYAIAGAWHREDQLYIARHAPPNSSIVLADYAFTTPAIPYALVPSARSAVVMYDVFSARMQRVRNQQLADSAAALDEADVSRFLTQLDAVIAIQKHEAEAIQRLLPDRRVLLAPHACRTVAAPQPGDSHTLLFVGSNTAPNVTALQWFLTEIWQEIRASVAECRLKVAGSVTANFTGDVPGVQFLGVVPDLDPLYAEAGVVISPLTVGSGLKIKLIHALGQGKAIVATSISTEGCEDAVVKAIVQRDDARDFAEAVVQLLSDDTLRGHKAAQALEVAQRFYSPAACYSELLRFAAGCEQYGHNIDARCATPVPTIERSVDAHRLRL